MIKIIPAIDIIGGKCVRLSRGDFSEKKTYNENPVEVAKMFQDCGCTRLHLVDLDGAISHHMVNTHILEEIASKTNLVVDFGGGIKNEEDAKLAFNSGASMITGGSIAVKNPILFRNLINVYGSECIILGADANHGKIAVGGWLENSNHDIIPFIQDYMKSGITKVISTDIECDGMLSGPSIALYKKVLGACKGIHLIASGGVSCVNDITDLDNIKIPEVIVGKAIYEGKITLNDIKEINSK